MLTRTYQREMNRKSYLAEKKTELLNPGGTSCLVESLHVTAKHSLRLDINAGAAWISTPAQRGFLSDYSAILGELGELYEGRKANHINL